MPTHQGVECHVFLFNQGPDICIVTLELNALISSCFERMECIAIMAHITLDPFKQLGVESQPHTHTFIDNYIYIRTLQKSGCWNYLFPKVSQSSCKFTQANGFAPCSWVLHVTYAGRFCCNEKLAPCSGTVLVLVCLVLSLPGPQGAMNKDTRILTCNMGVSRNWEATTPPSLCFLVQKNLL